MWSWTPLPPPPWVCINASEIDGVIITWIMPNGNCCYLLIITSSALFFSLPKRLERPPCTKVLVYWLHQNGMYYVAMTYENLGLLKIKELILQKYPPPTMESKKVKGGGLIYLRVYKHEGMIVILLGPSCYSKCVLKKKLVFWNCNRTSFVWACGWHFGI
jgi:hypothetical protein